MLRGTKTVGAAFAQMGNNLALSVIQSLTKMVLKSAEHDLLMLAHRRITNIAMTTSDAQQAAKSGTIAQTSQLKKMALDIAGLFHHQTIKATEVVADQTAAVGEATAATSGAIASTTATTTAATAKIGAHAATAAAGAASSQASIPYIGPILAIAAAATMMGLVMGFAKFEDGTGYIPRTGMAMLHEGEAVIPAPTMQELRGSSGGSGDVNITQHNSWQAGSNQDFQRQLRQNASHVAAAVQKHLRQAGK